jgi:hypothetical protein
MCDPSGARPEYTIRSVQFTTENACQKVTQLALRPLILALRPLILALRPLVLALRPLILALRPLILALRPLVLASRPLILASRPLVLASRPRRGAHTHRGCERKRAAGQCVKLMVCA